MSTGKKESTRRCIAATLTTSVFAGCSTGTTLAEDHGYRTDLVHHIPIDGAIVSPVWHSPI